MKSDVISVSSREDRTEEVLEQAEKVAAYHHLSHKGGLHLRLLAEEMMGLMRAITKEVNGDFWIESHGDEFELHLLAITEMDFYKREKLLAASTSGKNEAHRGLMGKLRAFFEPLDGIPVDFGISADGSAQPGSLWSLQAYQEKIQRHLKDGQEGAQEAWDELERSVIAHVADEVKVRIDGFEAEMVAYKRLS